MRTFWRAHMDGWKRSDLNQRECCEVHGLSLKNFGNWRAQLKRVGWVERSETHA